MDYYSGYISKLIEELSILPGIGAKTASRLAFYILDMPQEQVEELSQSIIDAKKNVKYCKKCFTLTDQDICPICASKDRDHKTIMVVENTKDMAAYEKVGEYKGVKNGYISVTPLQIERTDFSKLETLNNLGGILNGIND